MDTKPATAKKPRITVTKGVRLTPDELVHVGMLLTQYPECASEAELLRQATLIGLYVLAAQATGQPAHGGYQPDELIALLKYRVLPAIDFLFAYDAYPALYRVHAAGSAIVTLLLAAGAGEVTVWDREGLLSRDDDQLSEAKARLAEVTNSELRRGELHDGLKGADVFIGVSAPNVLRPEWLADMAADPVVFALANPDPEIDPVAAAPFAAVVASGRSDYPNQINNVLAFPGVFRGLLDARAQEITIDMLLRAADAIARTVKDEELNPSFIIPSVFNMEVPKAVAAAISHRDGS